MYHTATYWVLFYLLNDAAAAAAVQREMEDVFGDRPPSTEFEVKDEELNRLKVRSWTHCTPSFV